MRNLAEIYSASCAAKGNETFFTVYEILAHKFTSRTILFLNQNLNSTVNLCVKEEYFLFINFHIISWIYELGRDLYDESLKCLLHEMRRTKIFKKCFITFDRPWKSNAIEIFFFIRYLLYHWVYSVAAKNKATTELKIPISCRVWMLAKARKKFAPRILKRNIINRIMNRGIKTV